jgi:hypothetical protein
MSAGTWPVAAWLSFRRIVEIPFETCVAALENWQRRRQDGELHIGPSRLRGPIVHDRDSGTCRIEVHLARGPLRPPLRMRLEIERWSRAPARTALELIPCRRVRPTATYFGAGHLLLDSLTDSLRNACPRTALTTSRKPTTHAHRDNPGPGASLEAFDFLQQCPLPQRPGRALPPTSTADTPP